MAEVGVLVVVSKEESRGGGGGGAVGKELLIYSSRTLAGGETVDVVLGVCVCAGVYRGG